MTVITSWPCLTTPPSGSCNPLPRPPDSHGRWTWIWRIRWRNSFHPSVWFFFSLLLFFLTSCPASGGTSAQEPNKQSHQEEKEVCTALSINEASVHLHLPTFLFLFWIFFFFLFFLACGVCAYVTLQVCVCIHWSVYRETHNTGTGPDGWNSLEFHTFVSPGAHKLHRVTPAPRFSVYFSV